MLKNTKGGFVGLIFLIVAVVAIGATSLFLYTNKKPEPAPKIETPQVTASVINNETVSDIATTTSTVTTMDSTSSPQTTKTVTKVVASTVTKTTVQKPVAVTTQKPVVKTTPPIVIQKIETQNPPAEVVSEPTLVVKAGTQPAPTLLLADARRVPFTTVELTAKGGDIDVESLTVERKGFGSDHIFTEVGVVDVDFERALNGNHQYFTHDTFTIKDGETKEIVLFGNITDQTTLVDYSGQSPSLALVAIKTSAKIEGTLPVTGTQQTANSSLVIGSLELTNSGLDPGVERNIYINSQNIIFSGVRGTAGGSEPILLKEFSWFQTGSASKFDLANVQTCISYKAGANCYPAESDDNGRYYTTDFPVDIKIDKGDSFDIYIKGDTLTTGSGRTIDFDINSSYDVWAYGTNYNNYLYSFGGTDEGAQPEGSFSTSEYPFYNGFTHTISGGSFTNIGR